MKIEEKLFMIGKRKFVHTSHFELLKEKADTIKKRLNRGKISEFKAYDKKGKRYAYLLNGQWWIEI